MKIKTLQKFCYVITQTDCIWILDIARDRDWADISILVSKKIHYIAMYGVKT